MIEVDRIVECQCKKPDDEYIDRAIRPKLLSDYIGQPQVKRANGNFHPSSKITPDALDHLLIFGPED